MPEKSIDSVVHCWIALVLFIYFFSFEIQLFWATVLVMSQCKQQLNLKYVTLSMGCLFPIVANNETLQCVILLGMNSEVGGRIYITRSQRFTHIYKHSSYAHCAVQTVQPPAFP